MRKQKMWTAPDGKKFPLCKVWNRDEFDNAVRPVLASVEPGGVCVAVNGVERNWDQHYNSSVVGWLHHEPVYEQSTRPMDYRDREKLLGAKVEKRGGEYVACITGCTKEYVNLSGSLYTYELLHENFTFLDGSPIETEDN